MHRCVVFSKLEKVIFKFQNWEVFVQERDQLARDGSPSSGAWSGEQAEPTCTPTVHCAPKSWSGFPQVGANSVVVEYRQGGGGVCREGARQQEEGGAGYTR